MVHEDADAPLRGGGGELPNPFDEVVGAIQHLDDDASMRRSWPPQTFWTSSASCLPSTQILDARAVRARAPSTYTEPLAEIFGALDLFGAGRVSTTGCPSIMKPGPSGKERRRPR